MTYADAFKAATMPQWLLYRLIKILLLANFKMERKSNRQNRLYFKLTVASTHYIAAEINVHRLQVSDLRPQSVEVETFSEAH